jgi:hypothetical protein
MWLETLSILSERKKGLAFKTFLALFRMSWMNPRGHTHPHHALPKRSPITKNPTI